MHGKPRVSLLVDLRDVVYSCAGMKLWRPQLAALFRAPRPLPEAENSSARGHFGPSFLSPLAVGAVLSVSSVFRFCFVLFHSSIVN